MMLTKQKTAKIPHWWCFTTQVRAVPLIGWNLVNFLWSLTIQKHYQDVGGDTLCLGLFLGGHFIGKPVVMPWNVGCSSQTICVVDLCDKLLQCAKKVVTDSLGLVHFLSGLEWILFLTGLMGKWSFWGIQITKELWNQFCSSKSFGASWNDVWASIC